MYIDHWERVNTFFPAFFFLRPYLLTTTAAVG
jgi:hypothetical protein